MHEPSETQVGVPVTDGPPEHTSVRSRFRSRLLRLTSDRRVELAIVLVVLAVAVSVPSWAALDQLFFWETVLIQALFATSVALLIGQADMPSFGQAAFFGIGAYTAALLNGRVPFVVAIVAAVAFGAIAGSVLGFGIRKLSGMAFAMVTLAIAQMLYLIAMQSDRLGGENGLPNIFPGGLTTSGVWYLVLACCTIGIAFFWVVVNSPLGAALRGLRDDTTRLGALGANPRTLRVMALTLAGAGAGLAGSMNAYSLGIVTTENLFWTQSALPIFMIVIGGVRTFWGAAVGAVILTWLTHELSQRTSGYILYLGILLAFVIIVMPQGVLGLLGTSRRGGAR